MANFPHPSLRLSHIPSILLLLAFLPVQSVKLDSNGYYDIVVAISDKTAQNDNEKYLDNLKRGIQDLSHAIWESTKENFAIRNVDIVLPNHWEVEADALATTQTYLNADIRVSHEYLVPQTINPTFCGYPGRYIELPYSFFDKTDFGPFGLTGKALLPLWARYRWGIFEENGFPDDPIFPYYWKEWAPNGTKQEEPWRVTGCFNSEIKGQYKTSENQTCGPDYVPTTTTSEIPLVAEGDDGVYPPPSDCRFHPDTYNQTATTSLMSFTFITSLMDFCDEDTHNKRAPNRQNLFCHFKSAWEIMHQSHDWKRREENATTERTLVTFRILKKTEKPLVVILSDGVIEPPESLKNAMEKQINELFSKSEHWDVLTTLGVYPGDDKKDSFDTVYEWDTPRKNTSALIAALEASFQSRANDKFRHFGAALQDIGTLIKEREHRSGAVVIILKYGPETDYFLQNQWQAHEAEVLSVVLPQNIRVLALEGQNESRLKNIAQLSEGLHVQIGIDDDNDEQHVGTVFSYVEKILSDGHVPTSKYKLVFRDSRTYTETTIKMDVPVLVESDLKSLMFYFYSPAQSYDLYDVQFDNPPVPNAQLIPDQTWGTGYGSFVFLSAYCTFTPEYSLPRYSEWPISLTTSSYEIKASIVVIGEVADSVPTTANESDIKIEIFTSADYDDNVIDFRTESLLSPKGVSFAIYAKLEKNGHPIHSTNDKLKVTADVWTYEDGEALSPGFDPGLRFAQISLFDNGPQEGNPDLTANDGIFSGSFISYYYEELPGAVATAIQQITVSAMLIENSNSSRQRRFVVPEDQVYIRCGSAYQGCWNEPVKDSFFVSTSTKRRTQFLGSMEYVEKDLALATRIVDLRVENVLTSDGSSKFELKWTEPGVITLGSGSGNGLFPALEYEIYYAGDFENLLKENFTDKLYGVARPGSPGSSQSHPIYEVIPFGQSAWFMMRTIAFYGGRKAVWSNVAFLPETLESVATTTTTSTAPTPPTTSSTTRRPITSPKPTTTKATTTPRSTTARTSRTTTVPSTTPTTTTVEPTTRQFEITTEEPQRWYKTKEAIVTMSLFGVFMSILIIGVLSYAKVTHKI